MEFFVLGPLEVRVGRELLGLGGPKPRAVLADLLVHAGSVVSRDRLIDDLWGAGQPSSAEAIVQNAISRLRKSLGQAAIGTIAPGYVLEADPGSIDARRFERLVRDARPLPAGERVGVLRDALALWRGPAFMDLAFEGFLQGEIGRLDELRLTAFEDRLEAEIELGLHDRVAAELEALTAQEPTRERLLRLQMLALHRAGRTQDALDAYERARRVIDDLSGLEPGAETRALQLMILRDDPTITPTSPVVSRRRGALRTVALLVAQVDVDPFVDLEAAAAAVQKARETLRGTVTRHGGGVAPGLGYETVAFFGAEEAHEDDVVRAGRAAVETREILLGQGAVARFAIGVGRFVVEDGIPILVGAQLEEVRRAVAEAPRGKVVVVSPADRSDGGAFRLRAGRGRRELLAVRSGRVTIAAATTALVGRGEELERLGEAFSAVCASKAPAHVVVVGDAGLGKTRLMREFAERIDELVLRAMCDPYGDGITFLPLRELADQASAIDRTAPSIGDVTSAEEAFSDARMLLQHFLASRPVVLVLDDLQWAVPTFLDLVEYIVQSCEGPLFVVSGARPELLTSRPSWESSALQLGPLTVADTLRLVEVAPASSELSEDVVREIVETAGGIPLFAEQLVADARESRGEGTSVPPSLDAVLTSRLDRLAPGERELLQRAAVLGTRFGRATLAALADREELELAGRLDALERAGLVRPETDGSLSFGHALVRDAAYDGLTKMERVSLHEQAARAIDRLGGHDGYAAAAHLEAAAQLARDVGSRLTSLEFEAGRRLAEEGLVQWQGGDASGAVNLLGRANDLLPSRESLRLEVLIELGLALRASGDHEQAIAMLEEACAAARRARRRRIELRAQVELIIPGLSSAAWNDGDADTLLRRALPVFRRARDERALGQALLVRAFLSSIRCQFGHSEAAAEEAFPALVRSGYSPSRALLVIAAAALHGPSTVDAARERCETLRHLAAEERLAHASVDLIRAMIEGLAGETARARELLAIATRVFEDHGQRLMLLTDCATIGAEIEILAGDAERADAALRVAAAELSRSAETARAARIDAARAEVAYLMFDPGRALDLARHAQRQTRPADRHGIVTCMRIAGKALAEVRPGPAGPRLVRQALVALDGTDALELRSRVLADLADAEASCGTTEGLLAALDAAAAAASAKGSVPLERRISALRGLQKDGRPRTRSARGPVDA